MEEIPTFYKLPSSSRTRMYPERAAFRPHITAPHNSPASSTISTHLATVTRDKKLRRVRFADRQALARSIPQTETVLQISDSATRRGIQETRVTTKISGRSKSDAPIVHYSTKREICQVIRPAPARKCNRPVVLQIDDNDSSKNCNDPRALEHSRKPSTTETHILGFKYRKQCKICLRPFVMVLAALRNRDQPKTTRRHSIINATLIYKEIILPKTYLASPVKSKKLRRFYIAMSWMMTAGGLGVYIYMMLLAFSSNSEVLKQRPFFPFAVIVSNACLLAALFCNCML